MKHLSFLALFLGLFPGAFVLAAAPALAQDCPADLPLVTPGKLTMSINATIPPTQYIDENGNLIGLNREMGDEIAKRMCLDPVYVNVGFEVQIPGLATDRWDMINTSLYYSDERTKIMQLIPVRVVALSLITRQGNPLNVSDINGLAGHVVGVEIGGAEEKAIKSINAEQVAKGLAPMDVRLFNNYGDTFLALGAGQLDAVFASDNTGAYYQKRGQFTMAATGLLPGTATTMATDEVALARAVVDALNAMLEDGTYDRLTDGYGVTKIDVWKNWKGRFEYIYNPA